MKITDAFSGINLASSDDLKNIKYSSIRAKFKRNQEDFPKIDMLTDSTIDGCFGLTVNFTLQTRYFSMDDKKIVPFYVIESISSEIFENEILNKLNSNNDKDFFRKNYRQDKNKKYFNLNNDIHLKPYILNQIIDKLNLIEYNHIFLLENNLLKDWTTGYPMIKGSMIEGVFRSIAKRCGNSNDIIDELFGSEKCESDEDALLHKGSLKFTAAYFEKESSFYTIIKMDSNKRKLEHGPIVYEILEKGADSSFQIRYYPLDEKTDADAIFQLLCNSLRFLEDVGGFGAKQSLDWGRIKVINTVFDGDERLKDKYFEYFKEWDKNE